MPPLHQFIAENFHLCKAQKKALRQTSHVHAHMRLLLFLKTYFMTMAAEHLTQFTRMFFWSCMCIKDINKRLEERQEHIFSGGQWWVSLPGCRGSSLSLLWATCNWYNSTAEGHIRLSAGLLSLLLCSLLQLSVVAACLRYLTHTLNICSSTLSTFSARSNHSKNHIGRHFLFSHEFTPHCNYSV